ncbi:MAG: 4-(cytidine 5'-diphospho)-2-C-methyl-D-erythritol kinase [Rhodospirillales bacterium]|nr:4-(cytidine 5'-diphospho)-2-C-methyl-D-erythritol kinase [Rhodospirillales bacterium]
MTADQRQIIVAAAAKINLYLHVTGRRADGYHLLDSLVVFAGASDTVCITPADNLHLVIKGPYAGDIPTGPDNLVLKAALGLREAAGIKTGAEIVLEKNLPVASGIGGGSADAAASIRGLVRLWGLKGDAVNLAQLGLSLGADVPVCLFGQAAFMGGVGDKITPAPALPPAWLVLVNPGVGLSTPAVFAARRTLVGDAVSQSGQFDKSPTSAAELADLLSERSNDLADAAIHLQPVIADVLDTLGRTEGVLLARMSGSGATCFGLFKNEGGAAGAAVELGRNHPGWWTRATPLLCEAATLSG